MNDDYEDEIVHFKICESRPMFAAGESWVKYRQHEQSFLSREPRESLLGAARSNRIAYLTRLAAYLDERRVDGGVRAVVERELAICMSPYRFALAGSRSRARRLPRNAVQAAVRGGRELGDRVAPAPLRAVAGLVTHGGRRSPPPGWVHFGSLRRVTPLSAVSGLDRGTPVDHYYARRFLLAHRTNIRGCVLDIGDGSDWGALGHDGIDRVVHVASTAASGDGRYDCVILGHTALASEWDVRGAVGRAKGALAAGGVVLAILPGIFESARDRPRMSAALWRFTATSARKLFEEHFDPASLTVESYGNALAGVALLHGIASEELGPQELAHAEPRYETLVAVRAVR